MNTILRDAMEAGPGPKYRRLVEGITRAIETGALAPGDRLPPVRDLAWQLAVTPGTVARAFAVLAEAGRVQGEVGRGTFVAEATAPLHRPAPAMPRARPQNLEELYREMPREGDVLFAPRLPDLGQIALVREGLRQVAEADAAMLLNYPGARLQEDVRAHVLRWLPEDMQAEVTPEQIVMTNGGQSAIMVTLQALLFDAPPVVLAEELTYPGLYRAAELLGARVVPVPMDGEGLVPEALDEIAAREEARVLFTMPEAQNPTSIVTSNARRAAIAAIARRRGIHLVQDDCYRMGHPTGPSYRNLVPEFGWYISSLSKAITPSLRIGYAVAPEAMAGRLRRVVDANYYGLSAPMAHVAAHVMAHPDTPGLVVAMRDHMRAHVEVAVNVLGRFDISFGVDRPFIWLKLPNRWREARFVQALEAEGIRVRAGEEFAPRDAPPVHAVRISINGQMPLDRFRTVLGRIAWHLDNPPDRGGI